MTLLANALDTEFTPTKTGFVVQTTGGAVALFRKQDAAAAFVYVGQISNGQGYNVDNPFIGSVYKGVKVDGTPTFRADE